MTTETSNGQAQFTLIPDVVFCTIGGYVWQVTTTDAGPKKTAVAQAKVQIKDSARITVTDEDGRFKFKNLTPGQYTLVIQRADGATQERAIHVPPDYDVVIEESIVVGQISQKQAPEPPAADKTPEAPEEEPPAVVQVGVKGAEATPTKPERKRKTGPTSA